MFRSFSRALERQRPALRHWRRTLADPRGWHWGKLGLTAAVVGGLAGGVAYNERVRASSLREERVFNPGSALQAIESSLQTGDLLLFNRTLIAPGAASMHPLRLATVMMQKMHGRSEFDHVAVIVVRNSYPYVLERGIDGNITVRMNSNSISRATSCCPCRSLTRSLF